MKLQIIVAVVFTIGLATARSTSRSAKNVFFSEIFNNRVTIYTSAHDIVSLTVPISQLYVNNYIDFKENGSNPYMTVYFVEADINDKGEKDYKGLYSLRNGTATKLLETGTGADASPDDITQVYFSAKDGVYFFDSNVNKIEKYGSVTDSLIGIAKTNGSDIIYVLTEDHEVYKVSDNGNKKEKLEDVKDAQQIVLDYSNNLYFYGKDKVLYVVTADGVKKVNGLPENPTYVKLVKPPNIIPHKEQVIFGNDETFYDIYANGTSRLNELTLKIKPTAYGLESVVISYFGYNKNIYEYNMLRVLNIIHTMFSNDNKIIKYVATPEGIDFKIV